MLSRTRSLSGIRWAAVATALTMAALLATLLQAGHAVPVSAATNLLTNGGFESGLTGWTVTSGDVDVVAGWQPSEGTKSLDLNGFTPGTITQSFATFPGKPYQVLFDLAGNPGHGGVVTVQVSAAGQSTTYTFDTAGHSESNMGWTPQAFNFTANSGSATLTFASLTSGPSSCAIFNACGPALDNIRAFLVNNAPTVGANPGSGTFNVPGTSNNFSTGITLNNNSVSITASGAWTCSGPVGNSPCQTGPDGTGIPGHYNPPFLAEGLSEFSLIARVGSGPWQFVGAGPTTISGTGALILAMNDTFWGDNAGSMNVVVTPAAIANEGSAVTEQGSYSDPDGDNVTITASTGSVTKIGTGSGTWSWSNAAPDGPASYTVTITADDGYGGTAQTTFKVIINNVAPSLTVNVGANNTVYYVNWTAANPGGGTASGVINLPDGSTVDVTFQAVNPDNTPSFFYGAQTNGGTNYWIPSAPYISAQVPNAPPDADILQLSGGNATVYRVTFSQAIANPIMAIVSLGSSSNTTTYNFDSPFTIVSQGVGYWGGCGNCLVQLPNNVLQGTEGHGTIKFIGTYTTFSWTVPSPEVWHGFTFAIQSTTALGNINVNEGATATNSGTWSDPGINDNVVLTASVGNVVKNANGTWSWSFNTTDGPAQTQTVTITATDKDGGTASKTFPLTVNNVAPIVTAASNQQSTVGENHTFTLGSFADPGTNDALWSVDVNWGDGSAHTVFAASSTGAIASKQHAYQTASSPTVTVTVTDKDGGVSNAAMFQVTVQKAATTTAIGTSAATVSYGTSVTFTATVSVVAPGLGNPSGTVTFSDGAANLGTGTLSTTAGVTTATFGTSALDIGVHQVKATYAGDANFTGSASTTITETVNVQPPAGFPPALATAIIQTFQGLAASIPPGQTTLVNEMNAAAQALANGDLAGATTALNQLYGTVKSEATSGHLTIPQVLALMTYGPGIQSLIGTGGFNLPTAQGGMGLSAADAQALGVFLQTPFTNAITIVGLQGPADLVNPIFAIGIDIANGNIAQAFSDITTFYQGIQNEATSGHLTTAQAEQLITDGGLIQTSLINHGPPTAQQLALAQVLTPLFEGLANTIPGQLTGPADLVGPLLAVAFNLNGYNVTGATQALNQLYAGVKNEATSGHLTIPQVLALMTYGPGIQSLIGTGGFNLPTAQGGLGLSLANAQTVGVYLQTPFTDAITIVGLQGPADLVNPIFAIGIDIANGKMTQALNDLGTLYQGIQNEATSGHLTLAQVEALMQDASLISLTILDNQAGTSLTPTAQQLALGLALKPQFDAIAQAIPGGLTGDPAFTGPLFTMGIDLAKQDIAGAAAALAQLVQTVASRYASGGLTIIQAEALLAPAQAINAILGFGIDVPDLITATGPATANEGDSKTFTYQVYSVTHDTYTLSASCGANGSLAGTNAQATGGTFQCTFPDGPKSSTVAVFITDARGTLSNTVSIPVTIANVAPTATFNTSPLLLTQGGVTGVSLTSPFDPSSADTAAGFHYSFDCGQGGSLAATYAAAGTATSASCTFNNAGTFTVKGRVFDKDNGFSEYSATVTVIALQIQDFLTDSAFNPITSADAVFTPDKATNSLKLTATNPGTYYYNKVLTNTGNAPLSATVSLAVPADFCLKGSVPVHIFADLARTVDVTSQATITGVTQPINGANSLSLTCVPSVTVTTTVPAGGLRYLTVHLDYKLKGTTGYPAGSDTTFRMSYRFVETLSVAGYTGTVQDATGFAVVGKNVTAIGGIALDTNNAYKSGLTVRVFGGSTDVTVQVTAPDGFYFAAVPAGGPYSLELKNAQGTVRVATVSSVAAGQYVQADFQDINPADPLIEGYVYDSGTKGVAGAKVELYDAQGKLMATATTGASGWYAFRFSRPGTYTVKIVVSAGYMTTKSSATVTLKQFETARVDFVLQKG